MTYNSEWVYDIEVSIHQFNRLYSNTSHTIRPSTQDGSTIQRLAYNSSIDCIQTPLTQYDLQLRMGLLYRGQYTIVQQTIPTPLRQYNLQLRMGLLYRGQHTIVQQTVFKHLSHNTTYNSEWVYYIEINIQQFNRLYSNTSYTIQPSTQDGSTIQRLTYNSSIDCIPTPLTHYNLQLRMGLQYRVQHTIVQQTVFQHLSHNTTFNSGWVYYIEVSIQQFNRLYSNTSHTIQPSTQDGSTIQRSTYNSSIDCIQTPLTQYDLQLRMDLPYRGQYTIVQQTVFRHLSHNTTFNSGWVYYIEVSIQQFNRLYSNTSHTLQPSTQDGSTIQSLAYNSSIDCIPTPLTQYNLQLRMGLLYRGQHTIVQQTVCQHLSHNTTFNSGWVYYIEVNIQQFNRLFSNTSHTI